MDEVVDFVKRDPVAGYVAIAIIGARPPKPRIIVQLKGRSLVLPDWTGNEWRWFGEVAVRYSDAVDKARAGIDSVRSANRKLTALDQNVMKERGDGKPTPLEASDYYDAAVRLVIAAHVASDREASGATFAQALKEAIPNAPRVIGESLASALGAGGDILKPIVVEALKITGEVFSQTFGIGIGVVLAIAAGWWLWNHSKHSKEE
jgi:hypothetical protein